MSLSLSKAEEEVLEAFARKLVDQSKARIIVPANKPASGFWFGGGNLVENAEGALFLVGRYRNEGDSRTGLHLGERGLELAILRSENRGKSFEKILSFSKADLTHDNQQVLSIEGSALHWTKDGIELFVSTEKDGIGYPAGWEQFSKPGTGVWTIDRIEADSIEGLKGASIQTILQSTDLQHLHVKDPFVYDSPSGEFSLFLCTHPYCWSSSNTAVTTFVGQGRSVYEVDYDFFPRGVTWDVAITRATCVIDVPPLGPFANRQVQLVFYDGGESLRNLDEHRTAVKRPRGYSCEEIGGVAYVVDNKWKEITRLSRYQPWFISPYGTGCSRYVDVHKSDDGHFTTWQQSQENLSKPLVMNFVSHEEVRECFATMAGKS